MNIKKEVLAQSSRIPKTFTDKGRIRVPPKHTAEWEGMGSPDLWDAICFAFLENVTYIAAERTVGGENLGQALEEEAEAMFDDIE